MTEEIKQTKKGFWKNASPTLTFFLGLISGIAVFSLISFLVLSSTFLQLQRPAGALGESIPADTEEVAEAEEEVPSVPPQSESPEAIGGVASFDEVEGEICKQGGKPIVQFFTTTWCPHCVWIAETFDSVVKEYAKAGKIIAHHWELDTGDDTLTEEIETQVPAEEEAVYRKFNPRGSIPTFVFGCKYFRIGNAHERNQDLEAEAADFRAVIEELLK